MGERIAIVGTCGSGKTTFAKELSQILNIPHVELDYLHWKEDWQKSSDEEFIAAIQQAAEKERWIIDGNYRRMRYLIWEKATMIIWFDYPFYLTFWRAFWRSFKRCFNKEKLWGTNYESFGRLFFSKESILAWVIKTYSINKKEIPELFKKPEYQHLKCVHLKTPAETAAYLERLRRKQWDNH